MAVPARGTGAFPGLHSRLRAAAEEDLSVLRGRRSAYRRLESLGITLGDCRSCVCPGGAVVSRGARRGAPRRTGGPHSNCAESRVWPPKGLCRQRALAKDRQSDPGCQAQRATRESSIRCRLPFAVGCARLTLEPSAHLADELREGLFRLGQRRNPALLPLQNGVPVVAPCHQ